MRPDFYRVVTEAPRGGSGLKNRKTRLRVSGKLYNPDFHDELPIREKMTHRNRVGGGDYKTFSDVQGPIEGFLRSRIGVLWNKTYSEIRAVISPNASEPIRHIWNVHLKGEIAFNCFLNEGGKVCHIGNFFGFEEVAGFYIHPITQTLEYKEYPPKHKNAIRTIGNGFEVLGWRDVDTGELWSEGKRLVVKIDEVTRAEKRKGFWFLLSYRNLTEEERNIRDLLGRVINVLPPLKLVSEKQASKKELRKLGLKNDHPVR